MKLIIARHLIPCTGGRAQVVEAETGILIESGLIRRVDRLEAFEEERRGGKVEIIDAGDSYVLPGLIDAHLHLSFSSSAQPFGKRRPADWTKPSHALQGRRQERTGSASGAKA